MTPYDKFKSLPNAKTYLKEGFLFEILDEQVMEMKWPNGFMCPQCGHDNGIDLHCRELTECSHCHKQTSVLSGTLFHGSHLPLLKWFWACIL